jgi:hypothetical protein
MSQQCQYFSEMLSMIWQGTVINQDIIHKHNNKLPKEGFQYRVHSALKCGCNTCEPKWHHLKLVVTMVSFKGCFILICRVHSYLMDPRLEVQSSEELGLCELIQYLINQGHGKLVLHCQRIKSSIIHTESPCSICLLDQ